MSIASSGCIAAAELVPAPARAGDEYPAHPGWPDAAEPALPPFRFDVAVVGLGYVGLPTALAFHAAGRTVLGLDLSERRLTDVRSGRVDLVDSDHDRLAGVGAAAAGTFELDHAVGRLAEARTVIVCVPTPVDAHLVPDLTMLRSACASVVAHAVEGQILILTSTTYVGATSDMLARPLAVRGLVAGADVAVAFSPERIDPGNDRHAHEGVPRVVGGTTGTCTERAASALGGYADHLHRVSSAEAAEMTKLVENTFRAVNIALANELAEIGGVLDLDVMEIINAAATKPYGFMPFFPGPGVGGHCIPCDPHYLLWQLRGRRHNSPLIEQAMAGIAARPHRVIQRSVEVLADRGRSLKGARVLVVGVAYKPDVEDVRESPALEILAELRARGAEVAYFDAHVPELRLPDGTRMATVADPAGFRADLAVVHTAHSHLDVGALAAVPAVLDTTYRLGDLPRRVAL